MMDLAARHESFGRVLAEIQQHQQGHHGWSVLHQALAYLHQSGQQQLRRTLDVCWANRPHISDAHLITLIGAAIRELALRWPSLSVVFQPDAPAGVRQSELERALAVHEADVIRSICDHSNSFTGARRFVVPQLIGGAFALAHGISEIRFIDIGTGLGILPRQLNSRVAFDRFAAGLKWSGRSLPYLSIPLTMRAGVDARPLPDLAWVRSCYGPSEYYEDRFAELMWSFERTDHVAAQVVLDELNILDDQALARHLRSGGFNLATCNFVLYQYDSTTREKILDTVVANLVAPGLLISMEPSHGLLRQGCRVNAYVAGRRQPHHVADISDAHFIGTAVLHEPQLEAILTRRVAQ